MRRAWAEFFLVGGGTLVLLPMAYLARRALGLADAEYAAGFLTFYAAYVVNDPHFAVTYVLFYRGVPFRDLPRAQRARHVLAGFVAPVVLVTWATAALALRAAEALGWMVQLMFLLVGWHYVKQGFGVFTVLAARRGVSPNPMERRLVLAHCYAGWAYAWASPATSAGEFEEKGLVYHALARPRWLEVTTGWVFAVSTVALVLTLAVRWHRRRAPLPVAPLAGLLVTVWSWTVYSAADPVLQYAIPALHSIQYLYFVALLKGNEARAYEGPPHFGKPAAVRVGALAVSSLALGWVLFRGAPSFFDAILTPRFGRGADAEALGPTPFFAAFFVVLSLHHYLMDAVLWRRDNPATRFLREGVGAG